MANAGEDIFEIEITLQSANGTSIVVNDSRITADHVVIDSVIPEAVGYKYVNDG